ncbi:type VI secretion system Vgr family protein [Noviherbaspirillum aerium]|uniref:type VI secretion system Vgr family protein n=1 Tax=Noviherbaspirillum aerium TaxID=2588497 RepID=UPI00124E8932|nr:type VI secretion system tip protein TssI/VgrG [Noviherbaspirillum aerium]
MSFKPFDDPEQDPLKGLVPSSPSSASPLSSLTSLAANAAALTGTVPKELHLASSALHAIDALQADTPGSALQHGLQAASRLNPNIARAAQAASLAQQAAEALHIAGHPLHGMAIRDFASPIAPFFPTFASTEQADTADDTQDTLAALAAAAIPQFNDSNRLLRFYSPLSSDKTLLIDTLHAQAGLSEGFHLHLQLLSTHAGIELKELMGRNVTVGIEQDDGSEHYLNGYIHHFAFTHADGGFAFYQAEVLPWMSFLTHRVNCRIFQDQTVQQVIDRILREDYQGIADYQFRLGGKYEPENYLVQYHESDAHFLHRLMERYGLFTYYEHRADGHTLVISDDSCNAAFCPPHQHHAKVEFNGGHRTHRTGGITQLSAQRSLQSSRVALNTFDFKAPSAPQYVEQPTLARQGDVPQLEVFDGNPAFMYRNVGEGAREAKQRMEVLEWQAKLFGGASDCRSLSPGRTFQLTEHHWFDGHDDSDADFLVVSVSIDARNNHADRGNAPVYANSFSCIRRKIPYRPRRQHKKPRMPGPQTATVVGPKGQEIHTDPHGRIKVQFPWDRYGRHDERSSCWIRVSQPWAGAGWGTVAIPRIGQEVVIDYLEGDPDRPLCTGRLYNSAQPLPYALPGAAHVMGFKSRSTPGGGGFCEMVIHDRKGRELINIHSQKDMVTTVQHTQATVVNGPHQTNTVTNGFQVTKVKKRVELESQTECIHLKAATKIVLEVGASRIEMEANGKITIQGLHVDVIGSQRIDLNTNNKAAIDSSLSAIEHKIYVENDVASAPESNVKNKPVVTQQPGLNPKQPYVKTNLGEEVDKLASKSPKLQNDLNKLKADGWEIQYGSNGAGSYADRHSVPPKIVIDGSLKGKTLSATQTLAHEAGHALYPYKADISSKAGYVNSALADEGAATLNNIKVQREIIKNGGPDIGIAGHPANHGIYNKAYDNYQKSGDSDSARNAIGKQFGKGEHTSTTGQPYADYYGEWYDKTYPKKK